MLNSATVSGYMKEWPFYTSSMQGRPSYKEDQKSIKFLAQV